MRRVGAATLVLLLAALPGGCSRTEPPGPAHAGAQLNADDQSRLLNPATRAAAARELGQRKVQVALPLLAPLVQDSDAEVRLAAIAALGQLGGRQAVEAVRLGAADKDRRVRLEVVKALSSISDALADKVLIEMSGDRDPEVRVGVAAALGRTDDARAIAALVDAFHDDERPVQEAAERSLLKIGAPAVSLLVRGLGGDAVTATQLRIARLLAKLNDPECAAPLVNAYRLACDETSQGDPKTRAELRALAAEALVALGGAAIAALDSPIIQANCRLPLKEAAAEVLTRLGAPAVPPIAKRLQSRKVFPDPGEPRLWVRVLGDIGDPAAAPGLVKAMALPDAALKTLVADAVRKIEARSGTKLDLSAPPVVAKTALPPTPAAPPPDWAKAATEVPIVDDGPSAHGKDHVFWHDVTLMLEGALFLGTPRNLEVYLGASEGKWSKYVMGWAQARTSLGRRGSFKETAYNAIDHEGVLTEARQAGDSILLRLDMTIHDDPWIPGGRGQYLIELKRDGQNLNGTFSGFFNGRPVSGIASGEIQRDLWPSPVEGWAPLQRAEHPRLLFRRSDLAALRRRAETPIGQEILARLRYTLGGGEEMPGEFSTATKAYGGGTRVSAGAGFTNWHAMGYGFLYQLTGQQNYAELARQCVLKMFEGVRDRDQRYSWVRPGGKLRAGWSYSAVALAYDFCYDAWDEAFRKQVAAAIQEKVFSTRKEMSKETFQDVEFAMAEPVDTDLVFRTGGGQHDPASNHYGAWNGGGGLALLGILGDPGTDDEIVWRSHRVFQRRAKRALLIGYSDVAYFFEGHHCGRLSCNTGLVPYLQALRVADGKDFVAHSRHAQWLLTKNLYELVRRGDWLDTLERGMYKSPKFGRGGNSSGGDFAFGFGACPEEHKPAVLWFYNHIIEPGPQKTYDAIVYPGHAVYAFVNWPIGLQETNPAEVLPSGLIASYGGYYAFRGQWKDQDDICITLGEGGMYHGFGKTDFCAGGYPLNSRTLYSEELPGRASVLTVSLGRQKEQTEIKCTAVDFSGLSGAPALVAETVIRVQEPEPAAAPASGEEAAKAKFIEMLKQKHIAEKLAPRIDDRPAEPPADAWWYSTRAYVGGHDFSIRTLQKGQAPEIRIVGEGRDRTIAAGRRTIGCDGQKLILGQSP